MIIFDRININMSKEENKKTFINLKVKSGEESETLSNNSRNAAGYRRGLDPFENEVDLSEKSKSESLSANLSTFSEIAARIETPAHIGDFQQNELDWFKFESRVRGMLSDNMNMLVNSLNKTNRLVTELKATAEL